MNHFHVTVSKTAAYYGAKALRELWDAGKFQGMYADDISVISHCLHELEVASNTTPEDIAALNFWADKQTPYPCTACGIRFARAEDLTEHMKTEHSPT